MKKRYLFAAVTFFSSFLFFIVQFTQLEWRYLALVTTLILNFFLLFLVYRKLKTERKVAALAAFPAVIITLSFSLFDLMISASLIGHLLILLFFVVNFYTAILSGNVFLVSFGFKRVPLYRAALTVNFLQLLLNVFLLFEVIFSLKMPFWINGLAAFFFLVPLFVHFFWTVEISAPSPFKKLVYAFVFSLICAETMITISFWPVGVWKGALYLTSFVYIIGGLFLSFCQERFFRKTVLEFFWVGIGIILALFFVTSWRGNF